MESFGLFRGVAQFVAVAEELSYRKAAARLGLSAAALSKAVIALEAELGVTLFQRTSRAVSLTREGEAFLARCRLAISTLREGREEATGARSAPRGELKVSTSFILAPHITLALSGLLARHPRLSFRLIVTDRLARFAEEGIDVAVRVGAPQEQGLTTRLLRKTRWVTVAAPGYLARRGLPNRVKDLTTHDCLRFVSPNGRPRPWLFQGETEPLRVEGPFVVDHGPTLLDAALAGLGVAQLLDFMVQEPLRQGQLIELLSSYSQEGPPLHAVCTQGRLKSANVKALFEALAQNFNAKPKFGEQYVWASKSEADGERAGTK